MLDDALLDVLRRHGGQPLMTWALRSACRRQGIQAKTRTVRLHLFSLERRGRVRRIRLGPAQPLCWALPDLVTPEPPSPSTPSRSSSHAAR